MKVRLTFIEEILGTASSNPEIHAEFIAPNAPDAPSRAEEIESIGVEEMIEKGKTIFPRVNGEPIIWDYQIKGFFKDDCAMLNRVKGTKSNELKAFRKVIDGLIFPQPRAIKINLPKGGTIGNCQRPLRAETAQGPRIALSNSETIPADSFIEFWA
jgi:hypothetical protein